MGFIGGFIVILLLFIFSCRKSDAGLPLETQEE